MNISLKRTLLLGPKTGKHGSNNIPAELYANTDEKGVKTLEREEIFKCHIGNCDYQTTISKSLDFHIKCK